MNLDDLKRLRDWMVCEGVVEAHWSPDGTVALRLRDEVTGETRPVDVQDELADILGREVADPLDDPMTFGEDPNGPVPGSKRPKTEGPSDAVT